MNTALDLREIKLIFTGSHSDARNAGVSAFRKISGKWAEIICK